MTATQICSECYHPRPDRHKVRCTVQLEQLHATIDDRWRELQLLGVRKYKTTGLGEGATQGYESTELINLTAYSHLDPDSKWWKYGPDDVDRPTLGVWAIRDYWRSKAAAVRGNWTDHAWVVHQPWIGDMVADLRTLAAQLLAATGTPLPKPVGWCTQILGIDPDNREEFLRCGEPLYMPQDTAPRGRDESIRGLPELACPHPDCDAVYRAADLIRIKLAAERERQERARRRPDLVSVIEGQEQRMYLGRTKADPARPWAYVTTDMYAAQLAAAAAGGAQ